MEIRERLLRRTPNKTGVYLLKDEEKNVIYIGKAISLKKRVREHLIPKPETPRGKLIRQQTKDVDFFVTVSEAEALILENNLIKEYSPPYNLRFRDDKSYPSLKVTMQEEFPSISVTRDISLDGSRYFGPYASAWGIRRVARLTQKLFMVRNCRDIISSEKRRKPCLNFQIDLCSAPCAGKIEKNEYQKSVNQLCLFLDGKIKRLVTKLEHEMNFSAENLEFEKAALIRDRLDAINNITQKQRVSMLHAGDIDAIGVETIGLKACIQLFFVRDGNLIGKDQTVIKLPVENTKSEVLTAFMEQRYLKKKDLPHRILLSDELSEPKFIHDWFKIKKVKTKISTPKSEFEKELIELVLKNAEENLKVETGGEFQKELIELKEVLGLDDIPIRIEGIDVSNISGEDAVGALITFLQGKPEKKDYRRYKIKTVKGIDDYAMIKEIVQRRYKRTTTQTMKEPDLLLIDGGIGHLTSAVEELDSMEIDVPVISISKKEEEVYLKGESTPINFKEESRALELVKQMRDEAHRFAKNYHTKLRTKRLKKTSLEEIHGIGNKKSKSLLAKFGNIEKIRETPIEEIAEIPTISKSLAQKIKNFLKNTE